MTPDSKSDILDHYTMGLKRGVTCQVAFVFTLPEYDLFDEGFTLREQLPNASFIDDKEPQAFRLVRYRQGRVETLLSLGFLSTIGNSKICMGI